MELKPIDCQIPEPTNKGLNHSDRPIKLIGDTPKKPIILLTTPVVGDVNKKIMDTITTVVIKKGMYVRFCMTFLYHKCRTSFSIRASIIGIGKPNIKE